MACTDVQCPIRVGDPCSLCHPGASGPHNCGLVYLVMCDSDLREELLRRWDDWLLAHGQPPRGEATSRADEAASPERSQPRLLTR